MVKLGLPSIYWSSGEIIVRGGINEPETEVRVRDPWGCSKEDGRGTA